MTTGPYVRNVATSDYSLYRKWYRTKLDPRPPLPFEFRTARNVRRLGPFANGVAQSSPVLLWDYVMSEASLPVQQVAFGRFRDKVQEEAMLAVNIAERKQAFAMIANRCKTLVSSVSLLRKGKWRKAVRVLGINETRPRKLLPKDPAKLWLEWHFGWSPLISDIHSAVEILQKEFKPRKVRVARRGTGHAQAVSKYVNVQTDWRIHVLLQAHVHVKNENLFLANQLGLVNPASVAWELIPFSFLVDWFIPVGEFLSSFTDFCGLELTDSFTTIYAPGYSKGFYTNKYGWDSYEDWTGAMMLRKMGIINPVKLTWPKMPNMGRERALTAVSLLVTWLSSLGTQSSR